MIKTLLKRLKSRLATKPLSEFATPGAAPSTVEISSSMKCSLHIREVDCGSCNACEMEIAALAQPTYDVERLGVHFTASPRHADVLMVTGPVSRNMKLALQKTYNATPSPKIVIAVGDCAKDGGVFKDSYAIVGGIDKVIPVDVHIPGCPPTPKEMMAVLMQLQKKKR